MDCCSQVVKYGMFISNLVIFVSKTFCAEVPLNPRNAQNWF